MTADEARNCQLKLLSCEAEIGRGDRSKSIGYLGVRPWLSLHGAEEGLRCEDTKGRRNGRHKRAASTLGAYRCVRDAGFAVGGVILGAATDHAGGAPWAAPALASAALVGAAALFAARYREPAEGGGAAPLADADAARDSNRKAAGGEGQLQLSTRPEPAAARGESPG